MPWNFFFKPIRGGWHLTLKLNLFDKSEESKEFRKSFQQPFRRGFNRWERVLRLSRSSWCLEGDVLLEIDENSCFLSNILLLNLDYRIIQNGFS